MEKKMLKHLTVKGFVNETDLTQCELMEKRLSNAKVALRNAKKEVKLAKQRLNQAMEDAINKLENKHEETSESQYKLVNGPGFPSVYSVGYLKSISENPNLIRP